MPYISADKNRLLIVEHDECDDPREWDNLGTMLCWHKRYKLGDKNPYNSPRDFFEDMVESYLSEDMNLDEKSDLFRILFENDIVILPVYLYDHSGITISVSDFGDKWDSGCVGFIYASPEKIKEEFGAVNDSIKKIIQKRLESEIQTYDYFLRGECYCFTFYNLNNGDLIDSMGGFVGEIDEIKEDIGSYLDYDPDSLRFLLDNLHWENELKTTTTIDFDAYRKENN